MESKNDPVARVMKLEQMKGLAYAIDLYDALITDLEDELQTEELNNGYTKK